MSDVLKALFSSTTRVALLRDFLVAGLRKRLEETEAVCRKHKR